MKNQLDYSEYIERYLDEEMGETELIWFKKELEANPVLQKELNLRLNVNHAIADEHRMSFKDQMDEAYNLVHHEEIKIRKRFNPVFAGSLIASILVGSFIIINILQKDISNQELFNKYYSPYEPTMTFRSSDVNNASELNMAMQKYQQGDFKNALVLFEKILKDDPSKIGLNFYSGISQMEINEYENAGNSFNKIIKEKYSLYYEQSQWYLSLCYLATGKTGEAINLLSIIVSEEGYYSKKAKKALRRINH